MSQKVALHQVQDTSDLKAAFISLLDALDQLPERARGVRALGLGAALVEAAGLNLVEAASQSRVAMLLLTSAKLHQVAGEIDDAASATDGSDFGIDACVA